MSSLSSLRSSRRGRRWRRTGELILFTSFIYLLLCKIIQAFSFSLVLPPFYTFLFCFLSCPLFPFSSSFLFFLHFFSFSLHFVFFFLTHFLFSSFLSFFLFFLKNSFFLSQCICPSSFLILAHVFISCSFSGWR